MPSVPLVRVIRSGLEESVHAGEAAVVDASGSVRAAVGEFGRMLYARSSMKPLQAAVSLSFAPFDFTEREVAVMCASHNAEPIHIETVRSILRKAAVPEDALQCPAARPWDDETLASDPEKRRINSDCSGKHAGMLAACAAQGWPLETYRELDHPLQQAIENAVRTASGRDDLHIGVDGCGVPVHAMPLGALATIYARLAVPAHLGDLEPFAQRAVTAMRAEPYLVAGRDRVDTAVMLATENVIAKGGAEGLMCAAILDQGVGVALKVRDGGGSRAPGPALIRVLALLGVLEGGRLEEISRFAHPPVLGGGAPVGEIVSDFELVR